MFSFKIVRAAVSGASLGISTLVKNPLIPRLPRIGISFLVGLATVIAIAFLQTTPASAQVVPLGIHNDCDHPIRVAVAVYLWEGCPPEGGECERRYENGWWFIDPGETIRLTDDGERLPIVPRPRSILYYAETTDGSNIAWRGDETSNNPRVYLPNGSLPRWKRATANEDGVLPLTCN